MQKIVPHLWFDKEAKQAAEFYVATFPDSKVISSSTLHDTPSGDADVVSFEILGYHFMAISAGPYFKINPSISFHVKCKTPAEVDAIWEKLSPGGTVLMELGSYPFSERYGWVQDKYGVSWQIIHAAGEYHQWIVPVLMFTQELCGNAEAAINFYTGLFEGAKVAFLSRYEAGASPVDQPGTIQYGHFILANQEFGAMDSAQDHKFKLNEAISLIVHCEDQAEIDYYWEKLSAVPEAEQCGWLKDQFGVSWQITPTAMNEMMASGDKEKIARVTQAFLKMKKFNIAKLEKAAEGK